jgi:hypothetical protein
MIVLNKGLFDPEFPEAGLMVRFDEKSALIKKYLGSEFKYIRQRRIDALDHVLASTVFVSIDRPKELLASLGRISETRRSLAAKPMLVFA